VYNYPSSIAREIQPWPSSFERPSNLYKLVVNNSQHPPLMQSKSWNLAVPFKEQRFTHTPSESIANNYTPTANELKIKSLNQKTTPRSKSRDNKSIFFLMRPFIFQIQSILAVNRFFFIKINHQQICTARFKANKS
jgi:hypothetical protein